MGNKGKVNTGLYVGELLGDDICELYQINESSVPDNIFLNGLYDEVVGTVREFFGTNLVTIDSLGNGQVTVTLLDSDQSNYTKSFSLIKIMQYVNSECDYTNINNI